jgi:hypothetical protein
MREYMLLIHNKMDHQDSWTPEYFDMFLKACEVYIGELKNAGKLITAQPLIREGKMISGKAGALKESPFNESEEVRVGYYHILADNMDDAVEIAKRNPEFVFSTTARIEVRPIKTSEATTGFVYPAMKAQETSRERGSNLHN